MACSSKACARGRNERPSPLSCTRFPRRSKSCISNWRSKSASAPLTYSFTIANVPAQDASGQTTQDFDTAGLLPYTLGNTSGTPAALVPGATGKALRLTSGANGDQNNAVFFPLTQDGPLDRVTVDLDFTIKVPQGGGRDGTPSRNCRRNKVEGICDNQLSA